MVVVITDKKKNDKWLDKQAVLEFSSTLCSDVSRDWIKEFDTLNEAMRWINLQVDKDNIEIETEDIVLGYMNGEWIEVFT